MMKQNDEIKEQRKRRMVWWREAKFGMFIHWGIYSILGRGEWAMFHERIPKDEYRKLADEFEPKSYRPEEWDKASKGSRNEVYGFNYQAP